MEMIPILVFWNWQYSVASPAPQFFYCIIALFFSLQENDSKRARAIKKANDERDLKKTKDREIER